MSGLASRRLFVTFALGACLSAGAGCHTRPAPAVGGAAGPAADGQVKLGVLLVFDQFRGDYLARWDAEFGDGGFRRLTRDGASFDNCHYDYAHTVTGAGHATLGTGATPSVHGIVGNDWYDRDLGETVYCATGPRAERVPPAAKVDVEPAATQKDVKVKKARASAGSPERLLAPTLATSLKAASGGRGRVVSLSMKDRAAILPVGRSADVACWFDTDSGAFVTSTAYSSRLPRWVVGYNRTKPADRWFGTDWTPLRPDLVASVFPDGGAAGQPGGLRQSSRFPHPLSGGLRAPGRRYYDSIYGSPFGNDVLLGLVERALEGEQLGRHDAPDLLCVSFSSNDAIGHAWGPDSPEVMDVTLRSDRVVRGLLDALDRQVGPGRYAVVMSADHGVCPLPELATAQHRDGGRLAPVELLTGAAEFLQATYAPGRPEARWFESTALPWLTLNRRVVAALGLHGIDIDAALADWLAKQPHVRGAWTKARLTGPSPAATEIEARIRASYYPSRCGDVYVLQDEYYLFSAPGPSAGGTTHGTPYDYDTHVPLVVYGPGVHGGRRTDPVVPEAASVILAHLLGIPPPAAATAPVPAGLRGE